jgi:hypothetical protein
VVNLVVLGREDSFTITIEDGIFIFLDDEEIVLARSFPSNDANIFIVCGENMVAVCPA